MRMVLFRTVWTNGYTRLRQCFCAQALASWPIAEGLSEIGTVPRPGYITQICLEFESVAVFRGVALSAHGLIGAQLNCCSLGIFLRVGVQAAGTMTLLALHVSQRLVERNV